MSDGKISIHDSDFLRRAVRRWKMDDHPWRRLRIDFLKNHLGVDAAIKNLPEPLQAEARSGIDFHRIKLAERHDSARDGATKLIFETADGLRFETVILRVATGRTSLCVSSQVGCAAGCVFCATGQMGITRNLDRDEILDQVAQAAEILRAEDRSLRNVVFMGMGEPFHNEDKVCLAIDRLTAPDGFNISRRKVLVSTVGETDAMRRFAARFPEVNLALSLHAAREDVRRSLVPQARKVHLEELKATVLETGALRGRPTMIEYVLLDGVNDRDEDVTALEQWLEGLDVHVNLIPFNDVDGSSALKSTPRPRRQEIADRLKETGFAVTLRYSLGADIAAACGQLVKPRSNSPTRN